MIKASTGGLKVRKKFSVTEILHRFMVELCLLGDLASVINLLPLS